MEKFRSRSPSPASSRVGPEPTHLETTAAAQALWNQKGCPSGCDETIWLEAEQQLRRRLLPGDNPRKKKIARGASRSGQTVGAPDLMSELNARFPEQIGPATTAL